jgi:hypothetical protein
VEPSSLLQSEVVSTDASKHAASRNSTGPILPVRLAHALSVIAQTLPNPWDESTDYFMPFHVELAEGKPLDAENLRHALHIGAPYSVDLASVDLAAIGAELGSDELAAGFRVLDAAMRATLSSITRVSARAPGVVRVRTWVLGRLVGSGALVGLRTESTET